MGKSAAQWRTTVTAAPSVEARVIDIRTRKPWRPPEPVEWSFLFDIVITFSLVTLGAWLFYKMRGG